MHTELYFLYFQIGELLTVIPTPFIKDCEEELLKARTHGPEFRIRSIVISSGIDDANLNNLSKFHYFLFLDENCYCHGESRQSLLPSRY